MHLGGADRAQEADDRRVAGQAGEGEHRPGIGGLVVLERTVIGRPSTPFSLTSSSASFTPVCWKPPDSAAGPVSGTVMPILIGSAARATNGMANVPAEASISVRRVIATRVSPGRAGLVPAVTEAFQP